MSVTIDSLELEIKSNAKSAKSSIDALSDSLSKLKQSLQNGVVSELSSLSTALGNTKFGNAVTSLSSLSKTLSNMTFSKSVSTNLGKFIQAIKEIDDNALEAFGNNCESLATKLEPLSTQLKSISNSLTITKSALKSAAESTEDLGKSTKSYNTTGKVQVNVFTELWSKLKMANAYITRIGNTITGWISQSNSYIESLNLFTASMGEYASEAKSYAESVADIMGIDPSVWMQNQGVFMTLATGFGVTAERAYTMSTQLTQLGYDLSSFFNISYEDAFKKLQSGLSGELEPLRRLGFDLSKAKLEAIALSLSIDKTYDSMTQAEKAQLRYCAIMTQVTTAQGDMGRTLNAPSNQLRILQAQVTQCARAFGNIFIPILNKVLPYLIAIMKALRGIGDVLANLVGFELPEVDYSGLKSVTSGADDASDAIDDATASAKKLKNTILGIDELNVMADNSDSSSGSGDGASGLGDFDFELPTYDFLAEAVSSRVNEITNNIKEWLGLTGEITSWSDLFDTKLGHILIVATAIGACILGWRIGSGLLNGISEGISLLLALCQTATVVKTILDNMAFKLGVTLVIAGITLEGMGIADTISSGLDDEAVLKLFGGEATITAGGALIGAKFGSAALGGAIGAIVGGLGVAFAGIWDAIKNKLNWLNGLLIPAGTAATGAGVGAIIGSLGGPVGTGLGALIGLAVGLIVDHVILLFQEVVPRIGDFAQEAWIKVTEIWGNIKSWVSENVLTPVGNTITAIIAMITEKISPFVNWFVELFNQIKATVSDIFYNIGVIATGCVTLVETVWGKVADWFNEHVITPIKSFFEPIVAFISDMWDVFVTKAKVAVAIVKAAFSVFADYFRRIFSIAWSRVVKVFSVAGEIFTDIKDALEKAFKSIVNGLIKGLNNVISVPFKNINAALKVLKSITIFGTSPFGNLKEISIPQIPLLANGGVVNAGTMFIAGEAGAEVVGNVGSRTGVMNTEQMRDSVAQGVMQANAEQNSLLREEISLLRSLLAKDSTVKAYVGTSSLVSGLERKNRRDGKTIVPLGT